MTPKARKNLIEAIKARTSQYEKNALRVADEYRRLARESELSPEDIVVNIEPIDTGVIGSKNDSGWSIRRLP